MIKNNKQWRWGVLERDNFACVECGAKEKLHAHHIQHRADAPKLSLDLDNGITLCVDHHKLAHPEQVNWIMTGTKQMYQRIGEKLAGKKRPIEIGQKISAAKMGHTVSEETRQKLRLARLGQPNPFLGHHHTEEANRKNAEAHKGLKSHTTPHTEASRKKMSEARQGQVVWNKGLRGYRVGPMSEQTKARISEGLKRSWIERRRPTT